MTTLLKICPAIVGSKEEVVAFLQGKGLLHQQKRCSNCSSQMKFQKRRDIEDQYRYASYNICNHNNNNNNNNNNNFHGIIYITIISMGYYDTFNGIIYYK